MSQQDRKDHPDRGGDEGEPGYGTARLLATGGQLAEPRLVHGQLADGLGPRLGPVDDVDRVVGLAGREHDHPAQVGELSRPLNVGDVVVISGSLNRRDDQPALRAAQVLWLPEAYDQLLRELVLHLPIEQWLEPARWAELRELVMDAPGPVKLRLVCSRASGGGRSSVELAPADHYGVAWTPEFKTRMETFLGGARYELRATNQIARQKRKAWERRG